MNEELCNDMYEDKLILINILNVYLLIDSINILLTLSGSEIHSPFISFILSS